MSQITNLKFWKDVGYTDGATEIPPLGHVLSTPDLTFDQSVCPSKERLFREMQLPIDFSELLCMSYLHFDLEMDNGEDLSVYGWIDDVKIQSDNEGHPMTVVQWHVDPWRTFGSRARYGSGFVVRRPTTQHDFFQNFPFRCKDTVIDIPNILDKRLNDRFTGEVSWWVILAVQTENNEKTITSLKFITSPLGGIGDASTPRYYYIKSHTDFTKATALNFGDLMQCNFDERLGIDPERITGAWLSPVPPMGYNTVYGTGTEEDPFTTNHTSLDYTVWVSAVYTNDTRTCGYFETNAFSSWTISRFKKLYHTTYTLSDVFDRTAKEGRELMVLGPMGEILGAVPFSKSINTNLDVYLILSSSSAVLRIVCGSVSEGLVYEYPLPTLDVNSNSWSSYVYSGQRDYDIQQRSLNSMSKMIEGAAQGGAIGALIGAGTSNNALSGGQVSRFTKTIGITAGAGAIGGPVGVAAGAAIGALGSVIGGALDMTVFNDKFQQTEDKYHAAQVDTVLLSGIYFYYLSLYFPGNISIAHFSYDQHSVDTISDIKAVQGVSYNAPMDNCTSLIAGGGPMQITNLIVGGEIPTTVKKWIKQKFADGVRIVSR